MWVDSRPIRLVSTLELVTEVCVLHLCFGLLLSMLLEVLALLTEQFLLIFLRADKELFPDVFVEVLVDDGILTNHRCFTIYNLILMRALR